MRFTTREDIEAPVEAVFAAVSDFEGFERAALRRGAEVRRLGDHQRRGAGKGWLVHFRYRGRARELASEIVRFEPPHALTAFGGTGGIDGTLEVELTELAPRRTRLKLDLELRPKTIGARLFLQSLRLAKSSLTNRFKKRVHDFARRLERNQRAG
ncbi:MAG: SRPBCC family protein [Paracoccaceae bacterium]|nr:SRPBCC family protein [Paracoccaceae bacterium]